MSLGSKSKCPYHGGENVTVNGDFRKLLSYGADVKRVDPAKVNAVDLPFDFEQTPEELLLNLRHCTANLISAWFSEVEPQFVSEKESLAVGMSKETFHSFFSIFFRRSLHNWLSRKESEKDNDFVKVQLLLLCLADYDLNFGVSVDRYISSGLFTAVNFFGILNVALELTKNNYSVDVQRCEKVLRHPNLPKLIQVLARLKIRTIVKIDEFIDMNFDPEFGVLPKYHEGSFEIKDDGDGEFLTFSKVLFENLDRSSLDSRSNSVKSKVYTFCPALKGDVVGKMFELYLENYIKFVLCR